MGMAGDSAIHGLAALIETPLQFGSLRGRVRRFAVPERVRKNRQECLASGAASASDRPAMCEICYSSAISCTLWTFGS